MGTSLLAELLESFKKFHLISASNNVKHDTVQRYCKTIDQILEHFKPVCYEITASEISLDEQLVNMLKELDAAVIEAGDLLESWHSMISKINFVLQIETLVIKISSSTLKISELVTPLLPSPIDSTILKCIEETQYTNELKISAVIEKAIMDQKENNRSSPEDLDKISNFLNLSSNQNLLMEVIALEKLRAEVSCSETQEEVEKIDHIIALVAYMHDCLLQVKQLHSINGVPIPTDFCCPLSLELMSDPVIVASGQTYERAFIRKWLDDGFNVCPRTHQTLGHTNLIPNYTVKALIANWCELNDIKLPDPVKSMGLNIPSVSLKPTEASVPEFILPHSGSSAQINHQRSPEHGKVITSERDAYPSNGVYHATSLHLGSDSSPVQIVNGSDPSISKLSLVSTARNKEPSLEQRNIISGGQSTYQSRQDSEPSTDDERSPCHKRTESAPNAVSRENVQRPGNADQLSRVSSDLTHYNSDASGEIAQNAISSSSQREPEFVPPLDEVRPRNHNIWRRPTVPRIISMESRSDLSDVESEVRKLIEDLKSDAVDTLRTATEEIRLLAKHNMENRIVIANCGAISLLVGLLHSTDFKTQENAVTALLNLSINDNNKIAIANANAIDPLIYVLETGNSEAKENSAATLFSLSVIEENKVKIGRSGAIKPLVDLLANGTPRGKKDAATALFNLSIFHENKSRIVQAGAVRHLVELMDPAAGMVDKAVAVLANLATIPEGRTAIGQANGIPVLVEVVELGSARGKENAAAALLQLCTNSGRFCSQVLQEGAVPPLVALSQSGTPRAKEKTQALLSYFRNQRHANAGRRL